MGEYIMIGLVGFAVGALSVMLYYKTMDLIVNYLKKNGVKWRMKAFNFITSFLVGFFVAQYVHNWFLIIGIGIAWIFTLAIIDWIIDLTKLKYRRRIRE